MGHLIDVATGERRTMGLDLALGVIVLLAAIRGWLKGFLLQSIRLSGLVACVYVADPVRNLTKPYVLPHLPSVRPELVDRLLWWSSAAVSYVVLVGLASLIVKLSQRQAFGIAEPRRNDQFAGFLLGAFKGLIAAMFLAAGVQKYAQDRVEGISWAEEQVKTSKVLKWNAMYEPLAKIWASPPVRHFVEHVQRQGLTGPEASAEGGETKPLQAASSRPPRLLLPSASTWSLDTRGLDSEVARAVEAIKDELSRRRPGTAPAN
jgi:uncharacterized membrane protein required for colicin V production